MAEIPRLDSGRVGIANAPSAVTPNIQYRSAQPEVALEAEARMQGTISQKLDRMSSLIFREGTDLSQKAGLQWAAENPLTRDQLTAMVKGDMSTVSLGSPLNVFDNAVRKVRAFELSAHAEAEATTQLLDIYNRAEKGELDFEGVRTQIKAVTDGYGQSLAQVDPESSFKYRASLATMGNKVIDEAAKLETKKRMISNGIKVQRSYQDFLRISELYVNGEMPIDPATGQPFNKDDVVDTLAQNFLNNTIAMIGVNGAAQYQAQILKDLTDVKVNALSKFIADEFSTDPMALTKLKAGDAGRLSDVWQSLGEDAKAKVYQSYFTKIATDNKIKDELDKQNRVERELKAVDLYKQIEKSNNPTQKRELIKQMSELRVLSFEEINKLARGEGESNPMAVFNAIEGIHNGTITSSDQIRKLPLSSKDKVRMLEKLHSSDRADDRDLDSGLRRLAGVPTGLQFIDPKGAEFERLVKYQRDAEVIKQRLISEGKPANAQTIVRELQGQVEQNRNSEKAKSARNALKAYEDKAGGPITSATLSAWEQKVRGGKISNIKPQQYDQQIKRVRELVRQAEGDE